MVKRALVVGVAESVFPDLLTQARTDAAAVHDLLATEWKPKLLVDDDEPIRVDDLQKHLDVLFDPEDQREDPIRERDLLLYFTGHAAPDPKFDSSVWLLAQDGYAVSFLDLTRKVEACQSARSITLILDCCYSGDIAWHFKGIMQSLPQLTLLCACQAEESATAVAGKGSTFTAYLRNALKSPPAVGTALTADQIAATIRAYYRRAQASPRSGQGTPEPLLHVPERAPDVVLRHVEHTRRNTADHNDVGTALARSEHTLMLGPHREIELEQVGRRITLSWVVRPTGKRREWQSLTLAPTETARAVAAAGGTDAHVVLSRPGSTRVVRMSAEGRVLVAEVPRMGSASSAEFLVGSMLGKLAVTTSDGPQSPVTLSELDFRPAMDPVDG